VINGQLFDNFSYTATYSFLDVDDDDVSKTLPEYSATLILNYKYRAYHFNVTTQYLSEYSQSSTKGDGLGDYITIDASISKHLTDTSKLTLYGKNVTNEQYAEAYMSGYRSGMLGYIYNRGACVGLLYNIEF